MSPREQPAAVPGTTDEAGSGGHRAAKRALKIIEHVAAAPVPVSLTALARQMELPKSSAHALARTLDDEGYLSRDSRGGYTLGPRLLRLLNQLPHKLDLPRVARPIMQEVVDEVGETAILGVRQGAQIVYIEQVEAEHYIRYVAPLGEPRPLHSTSIGKVHLAFMSPDQLAAVLNGVKLERFTEHTLTTRSGLKAELTRIRAQRYAVNLEESMAGVAAVAVPIFEGPDGAERVIAGLSVAGPTERRRDELGSLVDRLTAAAERIAAEVTPRPVQGANR